MHRPLISVVVPVHNEEEVLPDLHERLRSSLAGLPGPYEVVYVDDGSTDGSARLIEAWARGEDNVLLVQLSRNFGMEIAMSAGLDHASGDNVVLMHADLQDPPELIPDMLQMAADEQADVVFARRIGRDESRLKRLLATGFYAMMARLARVPYQGQAGDFRLMTRRVTDTVRSDARAAPLPARHGRLGRLQAGADRVPAGGSPGRRRRLLPGAVPAGGGGAHVLLGRAAQHRHLRRGAERDDQRDRGRDGPGADAAGALTASTSVWILVAVLFLGGIQLMSIGVLGRYLAHVHDQVLERPLYLVSRVVRRDDG